jgi:bacteriocin biosynthesis cyclodehydratase domain-containing protein
LAAILNDSSDRTYHRFRVKDEIMSRLPCRPCLALPFTVLPGRDQVRLVAGEDFRFTLTGPSLETWLPGWLERLDGRRSLEEALAGLDPAHHDAARSLLERLAGERLVMEGPLELAPRPACTGLQLEGSGPLRTTLNGVAGVDTGGIRVLAQDKLDLAEALAFNERCLKGGLPWLWVSCAALSRAYISPIFLPDAGPCLACLLGHFRRLSPLPDLYDELVSHARHGGAFVPAPFAEPGLGILAQLVRWKADLFGRPEPPAVVFRLHVLEAGSLEVSSHPVLLDPECPACYGRR